MNRILLTPYVQSGTDGSAGVGSTDVGNEEKIYYVEADASWPENLSDSEGTVTVFFDESGIQVVGNNIIYVKDIPIHRAIPFVEKISIPISVEDLEDLGFERII